MNPMDERETELLGNLYPLFSITCSDLANRVCLDDCLNKKSS